MNTYRILFHGRRVNALGITSFQCLDIEAESPEAAKRKAYETHEHISGGLDGIRVASVKGDKS